MDANLLAEAFLAALGTPPRDDELGAHLQARLAAGREAWPQFLVDPACYAHFLGERIRRIGGDAFAVLSGLYTTDLYLVCGCRTGDGAAIVALRDRYFDDLDPVLWRLGATPSFMDEVKERMLERLFVTPPPKIDGYLGRSELRSWLRAVAARTALKMWERDPLRFASDQDIAELADDGPDPELAHLKQTYRAELRQAVLESLATLSPRQRTLLRQHYLDRLNLDRLAALYRVHRGTAARWIALARAALFDDTRTRLTSRLGLSPADFSSVVRLVQSRFDISVAEVLGRKG